MGGLALAADGDDSKPGLYLQGAFAMQATTGNVKTALESVGSSSNFYGGSLAVGYFITDWLAVQGRVQLLSGPSQSSLVTTWNMLYSGAVKVYPLNLGGSDDGFLQPYGIIGIGGQTLFASAGGFTDSTTAFLLEVGGGLDLMLTQDFGLFGEVTYEYLNDSDYSFNDSTSTNAIGLNVGISYRF